MKRNAEWKSLITLVVTIVGLMVPYWLWQADLNSKSLSVKIIAQVPLQPKEQDRVPGMEISVDGKKLDRPNLVMFEIKNDGRKPILATDFESPLEIRLEPKTSFIRVGITSKTPKDMEPTIASEPQRISLKSILLNPKDCINITALTSGADPALSSKARIVGIPHVTLEDASKEKPKTLNIITMLANSLIGFITLSVMIDALVNINDTIRKRTALVIMLGTLLSSMITFTRFMEIIEVEKVWYVVLILIGLLTVGMLIGSKLNQKILN